MRRVLPGAVMLVLTAVVSAGTTLAVGYAAIVAPLDRQFTRLNDRCQSLERSLFQSRIAEEEAPARFRLVSNIAPSSRTVEVLPVADEPPADPAPVAADPAPVPVPTEPSPVPAEQVPVPAPPAPAPAPPASEKAAEPAPAESVPPQEPERPASKEQEQLPDPEEPPAAPAPVVPLPVPPAPAPPVPAAAELPPAEVPLPVPPAPAAEAPAEPAPAPAAESMTPPAPAPAPVPPANEVKTEEQLPDPEEPPAAPARPAPARPAENVPPPPVPMPPPDLKPQEEVVPPPPVPAPPQTEAAPAPADVPPASLPAPAEVEVPPAAPSKLPTPPLPAVAAPAPPASAAPALPVVTKKEEAPKAPPMKRVLVTRPVTRQVQQYFNQWCDNGVCHPAGYYWVTVTEYQQFEELVPDTAPAAQPEPVRPSPQSVVTPSAPAPVTLTAPPAAKTAPVPQAPRTGFTPNGAPRSTNPDPQIAFLEDKVNDFRARYAQGPVNYLRYSGDLSAECAANNAAQVNQEGLLRRVASGLGHHVMWRRQTSSAQNAAYRAGSIDQVLIDWYNSSQTKNGVVGGHRAVLLDPAATEFGIAQHGNYWTFIVTPSSVPVERTTNVGGGLFGGRQRNQPGQASFGRSGQYRPRGGGLFGGLFRFGR